MRGRRRKKTYAESIKEMEDDRKYYERRIAKKPLASPCVEGRLKHTFRSPKTRSLTSDLKCWWCGKTVATVRKEQGKKH